MRLPKLVPLVAVLVCAQVTVAGAQVQWELTPFAGYYIASDLYNAYSTSVGGNARVGLSDSFMWGGRLTGSRGNVGIDFAYTRSGSDIRLDNLLAGQPRASGPPWSGSGTATVFRRKGLRAKRAGEPSSSRAITKRARDRGTRARIEIPGA